jgi:hypothetical protein
MSPSLVGELELRRGMIMEVCPDCGQVRLNLNVVLAQIGSGTDAAAEQDLLRTVCVGAEGHQVGAQFSGNSVKFGRSASFSCGGLGRQQRLQCPLQELAFGHVRRPRDRGLVRPRCVGFTAKPAE